MSATAPPPTVVEARGLTVDYLAARGRVRAVNGVDLAFREGETVAIVGESGCGKTTLGRALLGIVPENTETTGTALFRGKDLLALPPSALRRLLGRELALVFQDPMTRLDPLMTVADHFAELLRAHAPELDREARKARARAALEEVGVPPERLESYAHEFSGGMRQRIMIALAIALRPAFVVADEPTTALDVIVEAQILDLLRDVQKEKRLALALITHNLGLVAEAADRVAVMYAGDLVEEAPTRQLFAAPAHPYTQGLLASTIHLATVALASIPGSPPDLAKPPEGCRFHPRCPRARDICRTRPPMVDLGGGQRALCWFPGPEGAVAPQAPEASWGARIATAASAKEAATRE